MRIQKQILEKIKIKYALKLLFFDLVLPKISSSHCLSQSFARMTRHLNEKDNSKTQYETSPVSILNNSKQKMKRPLFSTVS